MSDLLQKRDDKGAYNSVVPDFQAELGKRNLGTFSNHFRMDEVCFENLLTKVAPLIVRKDPHFRKAVSPAHRLAVTLRYLATGSSFIDLHYNFRVSVLLISQIISETCNAIYDVLNEDYLKTPSSQQEWLTISDKLFEK